jgi:hypothetical protein
MFKVQALPDAAELDVEIALDVLERNFLTGVAGGEVDLAESPHADTSLDGVAIKGSRSAGIGKLHGTASRLLRPKRVVGTVAIGLRFQSSG